MTTAAIAGSGDEIVRLMSRSFSTEGEGESAMGDDDNDDDNDNINVDVRMTTTTTTDGDGNDDGIASSSIFRSTSWSTTTTTPTGQQQQQNTTTNPGNNRSSHGITTGMSTGSRLLGGTRPTGTIVIGGPANNNNKYHEVDRDSELSFQKQMNRGSHHTSMVSTSGGTEGTMDSTHHSYSIRSNRNNNHASRSTSNSNSNNSNNNSASNTPVPLLRKIPSSESVEYNISYSNVVDYHNDPQITTMPLTMPLSTQDNSNNNNNNDYTEAMVDVDAGLPSSLPPPRATTNTNSTGTSTSNLNLTSSFRRASVGSTATASRVPSITPSRTDEEHDRYGPEGTGAAHSTAATASAVQYNPVANSPCPPTRGNQIHQQEQQHQQQQQQQHLQIQGHQSIGEESLASFLAPQIVKARSMEEEEGADVLTSLVADRKRSPANNNNNNSYTFNHHSSGSDSFLDASSAVSFHDGSINHSNHNHNVINSNSHANGNANANVVSGHASTSTYSTLATNTPRSAVPISTTWTFEDEDMMPPSRGDSLLRPVVNSSLHDVATKDLDGRHQREIEVEHREGRDDYPRNQNLDGDWENLASMHGDPSGHAPSPRYYTYKNTGASNHNINISTRSGLSSAPSVGGRDIFVRKDHGDVDYEQQQQQQQQQQPTQRHVPQRTIPSKRSSAMSNASTGSSHRSSLLWGARSSSGDSPRRSVAKVDLSDMYDPNASTSSMNLQPVPPPPSSTDEELSKDQNSHQGYNPSVRRALPARQGSATQSQRSSLLWGDNGTSDSPRRSVVKVDLSEMYDPNASSSSVNFKPVPPPPTEGTAESDLEIMSPSMSSSHAGQKLVSSSSTPPPPPTLMEATSSHTYGTIDTNMTTGRGTASIDASRFADQDDLTMPPRGNSYLSPLSPVMSSSATVKSNTSTSGSARSRRMRPSAAYSNQRNRNNSPQSRVGSSRSLQSEPRTLRRGTRPSSAYPDQHRKGQRLSPRHFRKQSSPYRSGSSESITSLKSARSSSPASSEEFKAGTAVASRNHRPSRRGTRPSSAYPSQHGKGGARTSPRLSRTSVTPSPTRRTLSSDDDDMDMANEPTILLPAILSRNSSGPEIAPESPRTSMSRSMGTMSSSQLPTLRNAFGSEHGPTLPKPPFGMSPRSSNAGQHSKTRLVDVGNGIASRPGAVAVQGGGDGGGIGPLKTDKRPYSPAKRPGAGAVQGGDSIGPLKTDKRPIFTQASRSQRSSFKSIDGASAATRNKSSRSLRNSSHHTTATSTTHNTNGTRDIGDRRISGLSAYAADNGRLSTLSLESDSHHQSKSTNCLDDDNEESGGGGGVVVRQGQSVPRDRGEIQPDSMPSLPSIPYNPSGDADADAEDGDAGSVDDDDDDDDDGNTSRNTRNLFDNHNNQSPRTAAAALEKAGFTNFSELRRQRNAAGAAATAADPDPGDNAARNHRERLNRSISDDGGESDYEEYEGEDLDNNNPSRDRYIASDDDSEGFASVDSAIEPGAFAISTDRVQAREKGMLTNSERVLDVETNSSSGRGRNSSPRIPSSINRTHSGESFSSADGSSIGNHGWPHSSSPSTDPEQPSVAFHRGSTMTEGSVPMDAIVEVSERREVEGAMAKKGGNKKHLYIGLAIIVAVVLIGIVVVALMSGGDGNDGEGTTGLTPTPSPTIQVFPATPTPTAAPTTTQRFDEFVLLLQKYSDVSKLTDSSTPQYQAVAWLANRDTAQLDLQNDVEVVIQQRYLAALLFFSLQYKQPLSEQLLDEGDVVVLRDEVKFLSSQSICNWHDDVDTFNSGGAYSRGIYCDAGHIRGLYLYQSELKGTIPSEIFQLDSLQELVLAQNHITGTLPTEIGNSTQLSLINLVFNQLTGSIPETLWNVSSLEFLSMARNGFTGTIPNGLEKLSRLSFLDLEGCMLEGDVPMGLFQLAKLTHLDLGENGLLEPSLPSEIEYLNQLVTLDFAGTSLTGTIPREIGMLTSLEILDLSSTFVSGQIPEEIGNLSSLETLKLQNSDLSGPLPASFNDLTTLTTLNLGALSLTGDVNILCANENELSYTVGFFIRCGCCQFA